jgi:4-aminobutyrate aminotransferase
VIEGEGLLENARLVGGYAMKRLSDIKDRYTCLGDVRGLGLMIGVEFMKEGRPDAPGLKAVLNYCREQGLVMVECGVDKNIIRLAPPLVITKEEMDRGLDILEDAFRKTGVGICR